MYSFIRHQLQDEQIGQKPTLEIRGDDEEYESMTCEHFEPSPINNANTRSLRTS